MELTEQQQKMNSKIVELESARISLMGSLTEKDYSLLDKLIVIEKLSEQLKAKEDLQKNLEDAQRRIKFLEGQEEEAKKTIGELESVQDNYTRSKSKFDKTSLENQDLKFQVKTLSAQLSACNRKSGDYSTELQYLLTEQSNLVKCLKEAKDLASCEHLYLTTKAGTAADARPGGPAPDSSKDKPKVTPRKKKLAPRAAESSDEL